MTSKKTAATAAEATSSDVEVVYGDLTFSVPPTDDWPYTALVAFEDGKVASFVRAILGEEQHSEYLATNPKVRDFQGLVKAIQEALGIEGN